MFKLRQDKTVKSTSVGRKLSLEYDDRIVIIDKNINYEDFNMIIRDGYSFLFDFSRKDRSDKRPTIYINELEDIVNNYSYEKFCNYSKEHIISRKLLSKIITKYIDCNFIDNHTRIKNNVKNYYEEK